MIARKEFNILTLDYSQQKFLFWCRNGHNWCRNEHNWCRKGWFISYTRAFQIQVGTMRFCMGAENAKMKSAEKSAEMGGHQKINQVVNFDASDRINRSFYIKM